MKNRLGTLTVSLLLLTAAPALAAPATVNLRVEGSARTIYEAQLTTDGHDVTTASGGTHKCDGTNGNVEPSPGPSATAALDDAAKAGGFDWDGPYNSGFDDFFVTRIAEDDTPSDFSKSWGLLVNGVFSSKGGCQQRVQTGDDVVYVFSAFGTPLLELSGAPAAAATGESFTVTVKQNDGAGQRVPAPGAFVAGSTTGADGTASVSFDSPGVKRFKATRADSVRSNAAEVCVYVPGSGDCGTAKPGEPMPPPPAAPARDTTAPGVLLSLRDGGTYTRGPRTLRGRVDDSGGLWNVYLRVTKVESGAAALRCRWFSGRLERFTRARACEKARFIRLGANADWSYLLPQRLGRGRYVVEVKALDRAFNRGAAKASFRVR